MLIIQFPRVLLNIAVFLYLVGFGLYLLFAWLENVPTISDDYRNIFIVYMVALGCCVTYFIFCSLSRILEEKKVAVDFNFQRLDAVGPHDSALDALGRGVDDGTAQEGSQQHELVGVISALTAEVAQLRQVTQRTHTW